MVASLSPVRATEGETTEDPIVIRHVGQLAHVNDHEPWLQSRPGISLRTGADLIAHAPKAFPNVEFGITAQKEIGELVGTERYFRWVIECLDSASREIRAWTDGPFPHQNLPGPPTRESQTVRGTDRLKNMRKFPSPMGERLQFDYHMKARGSNMRMYYRAETDRRIILIGTLCDHLETAKY